MLLLVITLIPFLLSFNCMITSSPLEPIKSDGKCSLKCVKSDCVIKENKEICECWPEHGRRPKSNTECKECNCGKGANCTITGRTLTMWFDKIECICEDGYILKNGKCIVLTTESSTEEISTIVAEVENKCEADGSNKLCRSKQFKECFPMGDDYVCKCKDGYKQFAGKVLKTEYDACIRKNMCELDKENKLCPRLEFKKCVPKGEDDYDCVCVEGYKQVEGKNLKTDADSCIADMSTITVGTVEVPSSTLPDPSTISFTEETSSTLAGPCTNETCNNRGECIVDGNDFKCKCKPPYYGNRCRNECECKNGHCVEDSSGISKCECFHEYGFYKEKECRACNCGKKANCTFDRGYFIDDVYCICPNGEKLGKNLKCKDPCDDKPCKNGGTCESDGVHYICLCRKPYSGKTCEIDPCEDMPCKNGGICDSNGLNYKCLCKVPFSGKICEIDPCTFETCSDRGKCSVSGNNFTCKCENPYSGKRCEKDPCTDETCNNRGKCIVDGNDFKCKCYTPYSGSRCGNDPCTNENCNNRGKCSVNGINFKCSCKFPFSGKKCEIG